MAAHLIRLKLRLMVNGWKRSTFQLILSILGLAYLVGALFLGGIVFTALNEEPVDGRGAVVVLLMTAAVVLWLVLPVFFTGVDPTLDAANFATYGIPLRQLLPGLTAAGLISLPGLGTLVLLGLSALAWRGQPLAVAAAVIGAVLGAVFCVVLSYATTGLLSALAGRRRVRETLMVVAIVPLVLAGVILMQVMDTLAALWDQLPQIASVLTWTPLGSFLGLPWAVAQGDLLRAAALLGLSVLWILGAWALWGVAIRRSQDGRGTGEKIRSQKGLGLLGAVPATPAGAIAGRALIYWLKDPRYSASLVVLPALVVLFLFLSAGTDGLTLLLLGPLFGFTLGYSISADISYDGSAFALHVTAGVSGRDDRLGRISALLVWAAPVTVLATVISCAVSGEWQLLPGLLGLALGALLSGAAVSAVVSARFIYPVPKPGSSPFATPEGSMMRTMLVQLASMVVCAVLLAPTAVLFVIALVSGEALFQWLALVVGVGLGVLLLWLGIRLGAHWFDRAQAETYQQVLSFS